MATASVASTGKITEEQAGEALRALLQQPEAESAAVSEPEPAEPEVAEPEPAEPTGGEEQPAGEAAPEAAAAESDDVVSLKTRLAQAEAGRKAAVEAAEKRAQAMQERFAHSERILRDRYLKKSNVANQALQILKRARGPEGVPEADADRLIRDIESSMNPESASYVPPTQPQFTVEDQAIVLNSFLNEKTMTTEEAEEFGRWMRSDATTHLTPYEQAVAGRDLDGFLRLAHNRWQEGTKVADKEKQRNDAVLATKSVQRTQREAAKAASAAPSAPRKPSPTGPKPLNLKKLSHDDVSSLLRKAVEEAKSE